MDNLLIHLAPDIAAGMAIAAAAGLMRGFAGVGSGMLLLGRRRPGTAALRVPHGAATVGTSRRASYNSRRAAMLLPTALRPITAARRAARERTFPLAADPR